MSKNLNIIRERLAKQKILPLFYHADAQVTVGVGRALYQAGIRMIEFTNRGAGALQSFRALVDARNASMPGLLLAVGTISNAAEATEYIAAGADILISPFFDEGVAAIAKENEIAWLPGCMTPTEIHRAVSSGCTVVKLFPGNVLETGFLQAVKPLFRDTDFVITGGVDPEPASIGRWLNAGALATGLGSKLITKKLLEEGLYEQLSYQTSELMKSL